MENDRNNFCVVTLHYTADPAKRSKEWKEEAAAGLPPAGFAKEYDIDYTAFSGERVFPEFQQNKTNIIIPSPHPEFPTDQIYYAGFDYGSTNPSAFLVFTYYDGVVYCVWEYYKPCKNAKEFVKDLMECPYWGKIKFVFCDPNIIQVRNSRNSKGDICTFAQVLIDEGVRPGLLLPGGKEEQGWIAKMHTMWCDEGNIRFKIFDNCVNLIKELDAAVYEVQSERQLMSANFREAMQDKNNHAMDACKYFFNTHPQLERKKFKNPIMYTKW